MTSLLQIAPWLIALGLMAMLLFFVFRKQHLLKLQLAESLEAATALDLQLAVLTERASSADAEYGRKEQEANKQYAALLAEHSKLHEEMAELSSRHSTLRADMAAVTTKLQRIEELTRERDAARSELASLRVEKNSIDTNHAALQTKIAEERKASEDKLKLLQQAEVKMTKEFENLANRIFEEKHEKFSKVSKTNIESILTPMREQLTSFRERVDHVYDKENKERASLLTEINQLKLLNERIGTDALNLTKALKGDSKMRGNWGEMQLERLLEESGLSRGREYEVQVSLHDDKGKRLQPDVVIHLPEKKDVVIDSKVSLVAYEQYHAADNDAERQRQIRSHIASLRTHFTGLSAKNYDELIGVNSLDLVIMFVPIEPALLLAFEHEPNLFTEAFNQKILLVSPSTLMATLQIINNIWRYEHQNINAQQIATDAGRLHDQFVLFIEALEQVGAQLGKATESYEIAHKRLTSGKGNLVGRTVKLQKLGAKTKKVIDAQLLESAAVEEDEVEELEG
ncbi:MAG: DNA recombination protein RmuC [Proteobacteria bacterium]|nr:DNA recombination protein RmuC [Pseudomonadota bacterium]MBU1640615.1 DNA recombination protein RmuC [Pseudomonadota bacterium]